MAEERSARAAARACLVRIEAFGAHSDGALDETLAEFHLAERDRHLLHEMVLGVLRRRSYLDWVIERAGDIRAGEISSPILNILRIAAYQLLFLDRVPAHAAVDEAAEDAKRVEGIKAAGFVNAISRKIAGACEAVGSWPFPKNNLQRLAIEASHPLWLVRRCVARWGKETARDWLLANNAIPPVTLRVNRLRADRDHLLSVLKDAGFDARPTLYSPVGITVAKAGSPTRFPGFGEGLFYVQDEASQLIALIIGARPGERILDICAAPGGKTLGFAEQMEGKGEIVAVDSRPDRLERVRENAERLGVGIIRLKEADAARGLHLSDRRGFDRVLVDAPCTALGTLRRHPEAKWFKTEASVLESAALQIKILCGAAPWVKPGGELVYSTCTTELEENEEIARRFTAKFSDFVVADPGEHLPEAARRFIRPDGYFRTFPDGGEMDGFFAARFVKRRGV